MYWKDRLVKLEDKPGVIAVESEPFYDCVYIIDKPNKAFHLCIRGREVVMQIPYVREMVEEALAVLDAHGV